MGGKGDLVNYTSITATTAQEKADLKQKIDTIIDDAAGTITVIALVQAFPQEIVEELVEKIKEMEKK